MSVIKTHCNKFFDFLNPHAHRFEVEEIAHALSHLCRYTGHVDQFYSVAQHSVLVSYVVPPHMAMMGLLHDASEAYLGDVSSPLKALLSEYRAIEKNVEAAICEQFKLPFPLPPEIKEADLRMLVTERLALMPTGHQMDDEYWPDLEPYTNTSVDFPWGPRLAKVLFLERYHELKRQGY